MPHPDRHPSAYLPSAVLLLKGLGVTVGDLAGGTVTVSAPFLRFLIGELLARGDFDPEFYAARYPDVESARLAGDISSLREHFLTSGCFEGRLPHTLPFDPDWYVSRYQDLAQVYAATDVEGLRQHFETCGWLEGRAGTPESRRDADRWLEAVGGTR